MRVPSEYEAKLLGPLAGGDWEGPYGIPAPGDGGPWMRPFMKDTPFGPLPRLEGVEGGLEHHRASWASGASIEFASKLYQVLAPKMKVGEKYPTLFHSVTEVGAQADIVSERPSEAAPAERGFMRGGAASPAESAESGPASGSAVQNRWGELYFGDENKQTLFAEFTTKAGTLVKVALLEKMQEDARTKAVKATFAFHRHVVSGAGADVTFDGFEMCAPPRTMAEAMDL
jgi:hypothetical protein